MNAFLPLISCLCITRNHTCLLQRAINCFLAQTYPNKELLIVYEDDNTDTAAFLGKLPEDNRIKAITIPADPKMQLGALRNLSIQMARGSYICQWDDDDWYHACRLEAQYHALADSGKKACVLQQWLVYHAPTEKAYLSSKYTWEGSLLCEKTVFNDIGYSDTERGEELPVIKHLQKQNLLFTIKHMPFLYIYIYHGNNTWDAWHWNRLCTLGKQLAPVVSKTLGDILAETTTPQQATAVIDEMVRTNSLLQPAYK